MTLTPGTILNHYEIKSPLGAGGMGEVYRAADRSLGRDVALKVLPASMASDPERRERFRREARAVAALNHPNIVTIHSVEAAGEIHFLTMELVDGRSLAEMLQTGRPEAERGSARLREGDSAAERGGGAPRNLETEDIVALATQMANALAAAHSKGIVHRDLKPANVMITPEGRVKILDFGLAKQYAEATEGGGGRGEALTAAGTELGVVMGTAPYMSPEQIEGRPVDHRSDIFSFGTILYEMATGLRPFRADSTAALFSAILRDAPPPVSSVRRRAGSLEHLVGRCLEKDRERRIQTAIDVRNELDRIRLGTAPIPVPAEPERKSIAVLPFANVSADPENEFFSDGLTDEIITDLSGVKALRVISRNSSMQLKGSAKPLADIGRELGVRYLLTGTVRKAGHALRISAQLVDAGTDSPIWADKYTGTVDDIFDVQERVSRAIVAALKVTMAAQEDARLGLRRIRDPRAFEAYLQARAELRRHGASPERAATLIDRAVEIEGNTPPLRALRAFMNFSIVRGGTQKDMAPLDAAEAEARALAELVPDAPYGHALLGFVAYERGRLPEAARHLRKAAEIDPTDADVLFFLCITLQAAGQIQPALDLAQQFHDVDPLSPFSGAMLGVGGWWCGDPGLHLDAMERSMQLDLANPIIHWALGYTYALLGRAADAGAHASWMRTHVPALPYTHQLSSLVDAMEGRPAAALETIRQVDLTPLDAHQIFHISESYAMGGDSTKALALLEHAVDHGMYPYKFYEDYCPFMAPLRGQPEFDRIVTKARRRVEEFSRA